MDVEGKLKIAMLGHKRMPSREGGIEIVVEELSTRMVQLGHEVTCFNRRGHHISGKEFDSKIPDEYKGVKLESVFTVDRKGLSAVTSGIAGTIRAALGDYGIIHFHSEGFCAMLWLPKLLGKRCVATIHGIDWKREKWKNSLGSKYIRFGERMAVRYADEIIVLSRGIQRYFSDTYGRDTKYIPNGISKPGLREAELIRTRFGLEKDGYILFVGRIVPEKGIHYLLDAFRQLDTDKKLVIAGGVSDTDEYLKALKAKAEDNDRILFIGFVSGQILEELYSNAYIYVLPSDLEGMPLSLLEALSYGNCCVTSDIPECAEVAGHKAVIFRKGNTGDLTEKLRSLCEDEGMVRSYKSKAAEFLFQQYNWDDVVSKTLALYKGADIALHSGE